ncbi:MAG: glycosyltransferase family 4 protein [Chlorobium sp.]|uniref:glycosyltransferase family 4 protein n=1 Tax=Chlorobium sp. TaxID=1095 RepID=UPI0025BAEE9A|nr:glycosyltransferase family 4 protein [Chlorobium sp.]MCF8383438.1 glycosyltransferase family 4 protein [Chlorobium sp.]
MKICQLNHTDHYTGGARAAYRIHRSLMSSGFESRMYVNQSNTDDWSVCVPDRSTPARLFNKARTLFAGLPNCFFHSSSDTPYSASYVVSDWPGLLNNSECDVVHMHWIYEMMSIEDIAKIKKPLLWTLHDMWAFCGAEHYTEDFRWREGYYHHNRPSNESGFDLNRWAWSRKQKAWKEPIHIVTPSKWLGKCVQESKLMAGWPVSVIPNPIDTTLWRPVEKALARKIFNFPQDIPFLLFGANGGSKNPIKGYDKILKALELLAGEIKGLELIVFGQHAPEKSSDTGFKVRYTGHLYDDLTLCLLYSAADVLVVPSRIDNLPNTVVEALACGTPVIAFNACGLPDMIDHKVTGYLAEPFDVEDLARGIKWVLCDNAGYDDLCRKARQKAVREYDLDVVSRRYMRLYESILEA